MFMIMYSLIYIFCDLPDSDKQSNSHLAMLELKEREGALLPKLEQNNIMLALDWTKTHHIPAFCFSQ